MTFVAAGVATANAVAAVDPSIPSYTKTTGVSGNLSSVGSDTLANLMTLWAENYKKEYPNVNIQIQAAGSATAPPALTEGTSNLGPMSRKMKDTELAAFEQQLNVPGISGPVAAYSVPANIGELTLTLTSEVNKQTSVFASRTVNWICTAKNRRKRPLPH